MEKIWPLWMVLLPLIVFCLVVYIWTVILSKDKRVIRAILKAGDVVLTERELQRRQDGRLVSTVADLLPKLEKVFDLEKMLGYDLKRMLKLMGDKKKPERVYADHIVTSLIASSVLLAIPLITGFTGYILFFPLGFIVFILGQAQIVQRRFKTWQGDVVRDLPELIDKMRISLASGKDYLSALKKVRENSGPRLGHILEKLINDMQIMRPTQALDEFGKAFGMPVMIKFVAAMKIGIEVGYDQSEAYFNHIEQDIRDLRKLALDELTKNKPEKILSLKALMVAHAVVALSMAFFNLFSNLNKIF